MDAIMDWVMQIIIFILLATVVDLLIPRNTFKKYIRLVVGLILILVFLKPVFYIFNMDIEQALKESYQDIDKVESKVEQSENQSEFQKNEIQATQDAYILEEMTDKLKELANPSLKKQLDLAIAHISYEFDEGEDKTLDSMKQLTVTVQPSKRGESVVEPVDDVTVNTKQSDKPEKTIQREKVRKILTNEWEIDDERLQIEWGGGKS